jgi:hypothetical protein
LKVLAEKIGSTERPIERLSADDEAVPWLAGLPGIGKLLSVVIRWEVDDINRFQEAKKFASYTGLVPSTHASANRTVHGRLTKRGAAGPIVECVPVSTGHGWKDDQEVFGNEVGANCCVVNFVLLPRHTMYSRSSLPLS